MTDRNKGKSSKTKKYRGKKPWNKIILEPEAETNFQERCADLEGYIFDLGPRVSEKHSWTIKELDKYLGATYSDSCQPAIMTEIRATFPNPEKPTIPDLGIERPKIDADMTYPNKNNIDEAIHQKLRKRGG